jgi:hypothetical protein
MSRITITHDGGRRVTFQVTCDVADGIHQLLGAIPPIDEYDYYGDLTLVESRNQASRVWRESHARGCSE